MTDNHSSTDSEAERPPSSNEESEQSSTPENRENTSPATTSETPNEPDHPPERETMKAALPAAPTDEQAKKLMEQIQADSRTQLTLEPELHKAILELATKPAVTDSMLRELEKRFLPKVLEALMPKVEHRLFSLLVQADVLPRQALDDLERKQRQENNPNFDLGDRALGALQRRPAQPAPAGNPDMHDQGSPSYHPDPHPARGNPMQQPNNFPAERSRDPYPRQPSSAHPERPMNQSGLDMGPLA